MALAKPVERTSRTFNFLFIGNSFYEKGGYESLLAFERLDDSYDCRFTAIGDIPQSIYKRFGANAKITLSQRVPYSKVTEIYSNSDVLVFPTHFDTYGFVILEALSFGLPVITLDSFSGPELVQHEKTGLLLKTYFSCFADDYGYAAPTVAAVAKMRTQACSNPPDWYVTQLSESMERMMNDERLRKECSVNAKRQATEGKFSPRRSTEHLQRIYEEALGG